MLVRFDAVEERGVDGRVAQRGHRAEQLERPVRIAARHVALPAPGPRVDERLRVVESFGQAQDVETRMADERVAPVDDDVVHTIGPDIAGVQVTVDEYVGQTGGGDLVQAGRQVGHEFVYARVGAV